MVVAPVRAQSDDEVQARRTLESGRSFLRDGNHGEALKDFQSVLDRFPTSSVADDALLEIATYQLEIQRDPAAAGHGRRSCWESTRPPIRRRWRSCCKGAWRWPPGERRTG
jgi:hypothetical protein